MISNEIKLKTKLEKHANDNEKRCQALNEKIRTKLSQAQIIKQALSTKNLHKNSSKKIVFGDSESDLDNNNKSNNIKSVNNSKLRSSNEKNNPSLFDASSSDDENIEIKEKPQFAGKQGFKLLQLQSTYGNDERFKVDEKFLDAEEEETEENYNIDDEKNPETNNLALPLKSENANKSKKRKFEMIRYDSSIQDHEKYEIKDSVSNDEIPLKKKKKKKANEDCKKEMKPKIEVSKEKFFTVSKDITKSFKENKESAGCFSLLQTYGESLEENLDITSDEIIDEKKFVMKNNSQPPKQEKQEETNNVTTIAQGIWKESFFFSAEDPRLKDEALEAAENYDTTRKTLREIIRLRNKKNLKKKNPFKHKIGGMSKKQMAHMNVKKNSNNFRNKIFSKVRLNLN